MKCYWKTFRLCVLSLTISALSVGCGYTGPDGNSENGGSTPPPGGGTPGGGQPIDPASYSLKTEPLEFTEGSGPEESKAFPITFTLNKPLEADATIELELFATSFPLGVFEGRLLPSNTVTLSKGQSSFSLTLESFVDTIPEPTHNASWRARLNTAGKSANIQTDNGVKILDDDKMLGNLIGDPLERNNIVEAGTLIEWDLNGVQLPFSGEKYSITQKNGVPAEFMVKDDKLRVLIPAPEKFDSSNPHETRSGDLTFAVSSDRGDSYDVGWVLFRSSSFQPLAWSIHESDNLDESTPKTQWYLSGLQLETNTVHHVASKDIAAPSFTLAYDQSKYRIQSIDGAAISKLHNSHQIPNIASNLTQLTLSADGKKVSFNEQSWQQIVASLPEEDGIQIEFTFLMEKIDENGQPIVVGVDEPLLQQTFSVKSQLRLSSKTATITLAGAISDEELSTGKYYIVVKDSYANTPGDGTVFVKPVSSKTIQFERLYASIFDVTLIDLSGKYSGNNNLVIYKGDSAKTVTLEVNGAQSSTTKSASAKSNSVAASQTCALEGGQRLISSKEKDTKKNCSYTFTLSDVDDGSNKKKQLVIKATTNEWPAFSTSKESPYDDKWSAKLTTNIDIGLNVNENKAVKVSHNSTKDLYFISKCFKFSIPYDPKFTVDLSATNIADDQLHTKVSAYVRDCEPTASVSFVAKAFGPVSGGKRDFRFVHAKKSVADDDSSRLYLSIPKDLPSTISATNTHRAFDAYIDLTPYSSNTPLSDITIKKVALNLHKAQSGNTVAATIETIAIPSTPTSKAIITNEPSAATVKTHKRIALNNYALPQSLVTPTTGYEIFDTPIMLSAIVTYDIKGTEYTTEPALMTVTIPSLAITAASQFQPLYELRSIATGTNSAPIAATRWTQWNGNSTPTTGGGRYGGRDDAEAGDGWTSAQLWKNLIANALTIPACGPTDTAAHCDAQVADNQDFIDELKIGDASAFNVRCLATIDSNQGNANESWSKCKSIIKHATHHHGRSLDIRYLMPNGTVRDDEYSGQGTPSNKFYQKWCEYYAPSTTAAQKTAIRVELRNFALRNRNFIDWIKQAMSSTSTPFQKIFVGNNTKSLSGGGTAANATCSHPNAALPTLKTFLKGGVLPGNSVDNGTPTDTTDDNLSMWSLTDAELKQEIDHDNHIHIDFSYNPSAINH